MITHLVLVATLALARQEPEPSLPERVAAIERAVRSGDSDGGAELLEEALRALDVAEATASPGEIATALAALVRQARALGHTDALEGLLRRQAAFHSEHGGPAGDDATQARMLLASFLMGRGRGAEALEIAEGVGLDRPDPSRDAMSFRVHLWIGVLRQGQRDSAGALQVLEPLLDDLDHVPGLPPATGLELHLNLAEAYRDLFRHEAAIDHFTRFEESFEAVFPVEHPVVQRARDRLAGVYRRSGDAARGQPLLLANLEDLEARLPPSDERVLRARVLLAQNLQALGDHAAAREIASAVVGEPAAGRSRVLADASVLIGQAHQAEGRFDLAFGFLERGHRRLVDSLGEEHWDPIAAANSLASCLYEMGEDERAMRLHRRNLEVGLARFGELDEIVLAARVGLAATLKRVGRLRDARELEEHALAALDRLLPDDHPSVLSAKNNLSTTLSDMGDYQAALELQEEIAAAAPKNERQALTRLGNRAAVLLRTGDAQAARDLQARVLDGLAALLGPEHLEVQRARLQLSATCLSLGENERAEELADAALGVYASVQPDEHQDTLQAKALLASLASARGDHTRAAALLSEALRGAESLPEDDAVRLALLARRLGVARQGSEADEVRDLGLRLAKALRGLAARLGAERSPREIEARLHVRRGELSALAATALRSGDGPLVEAAVRTIETFRNAGLRAASLARIDGGVQDLRVELRAASAELTRAAREGAASRLADARRRRDAAYEGLRSARGAEQTDLDLEAAAEALAPDEVVIGYWTYEEPTGARVVDEPRRGLLAWTLTAGGLRLHDLGPLDEIARVASSLRAALSSGTPAEPARGVGVAGRAILDAERSAVRLGELVLEPLARELEGRGRVTVLLDGPLHEVPIDVVRFDGEPLGERFDVLQRVGILAPPRSDRKDAPEGSGSLLLVGGVDFADGGLPPLPGTLDEVRAIGATAQRALPGARVVALTGEAATREELLRLLPEARWVHLATHGRFEGPRTGPDLVVGTWNRLTESAPLTLCGLALAGPDGWDSGLSAEEIASLDLGGCRLAVLSACQSALGAAREGQGVYSLQRALVAAGAERVLASLWPVEDEATRALMTRFYELLWSEERTAGRALASVKGEMSRAGTSPTAWAGWVLLER